MGMLSDLTQFCISAAHDIWLQYRNLSARKERLKIMVCGSYTTTTGVSIASAIA